LEKVGTKNEEINTGHFIAVYFLIALFFCICKFKPAPAVLWFTFDYPSSSHPSVEKVKIIFCADAVCSSSVELSQIPNSSNYDLLQRAILL